MQLEKNLEEILAQLKQKDLDFLDFLDKINQAQLKNNLCYLESVSINKEDIKLILDAVNLRSDINLKLKELGNISSYRRQNERQIDFQAMIVEISFSKLLWDKYKNLSKYLKNKLEIKSPEIASVFLSHKKEDFYINDKLNNLILNFDIKSQFLNNRYQSVNINQLAHTRFLNNQAQFYIVGLIDGDPKNFESVKNIHFVIMPIDYFNNNKIDINEPPRPDIKQFSPYYHLDMKPFKDLLLL